MYFLSLSSLCFISQTQAFYCYSQTSWSGYVRSPCPFVYVKNREECIWIFFSADPSYIIYFFADFLLPQGSLHARPSHFFLGLNHSGTVPSAEFVSVDVNLMMHALVLLCLWQYCILYSCLYFMFIYNCQSGSTYVPDEE